MKLVKFVLLSVMSFCKSDLNPHNDGILTEIPSLNPTLLPSYNPTNHSLGYRHIPTSQPTDHSLGFAHIPTSAPTVLKSEKKKSEYKVRPIYSLLFVLLGMLVVFCCYSFIYRSCLIKRSDESNISKVFPDPNMVHSSLSPRVDSTKNDIIRLCNDCEQLKVENVENNLERTQSSVIVTIHENISEF